ncbi:hypothetical protein K488DRAFT_91175 [Vararia minispora EC-137]|uniref:Uncharacterized protein n=1 Tax=Vararia minispora EC-137 TaxID=1314806 RepID=A0ACB8Q606_9AGAM|nr:hypothetical protein K488DRAFT_91175 [Vararia minispora EC-137]
MLRCSPPPSSTHLHPHHTQQHRAYHHLRASDDAFDNAPPLRLSNTFGGSKPAAPCPERTSSATSTVSVPTRSASFYSIKSSSPATLCAQLWVALMCPHCRDDSLPDYDALFSSVSADEQLSFDGSHATTPAMLIGICLFVLAALKVHAATSLRWQRSVDAAMHRHALALGHRAGAHMIWRLEVRFPPTDTIRFMYDFVHNAILEDVKLIKFIPCHWQFPARKFKVRDLNVRDLLVAFVL